MIEPLEDEEGEHFIGTEELKRPARCGYLPVNRRGGLPCIKPEGHNGNHEDVTGCWWRR